MNQDFFNFIKPVLIKLKEKLGDNFVVFGSAPLYLFGVMEFDGEINDLDVTVPDFVSIPREAKEVIFHGDSNQKLYKITIDNIEIDIGSVWLGYEDIFKEILNEPIVVEGFKFANLDVVKKWKTEMARKYNRQKDKDYLKKIEKYLYKY